MKTLAWVVFVSGCWMVGCGSSNGGGGGQGGGGGAGGQGGEAGCPDEQVLGVVDGELACTGFNEGTELRAGPDFQCGDATPNTSCLVEDFCAVQGCGDPDSMFDASGCRRVICEVDGDCDQGQVCYATARDACLSTAEMACAPYGGEACDCVADLICGHESHCVDEADLPQQ